MITVLTFKWKPFSGYRSTYTAEHVNIFARMIRRNYRGPCRIVCVTDDAEGIDREMIEVVPLWNDHAALRSPHDANGPRRNPSCYRRLKMFARDAGSWLGERVMALDLDIVVTGDLTPLFHRPEPIVLWGDTNPQTYYNGGMILFNPGWFPELWEDFDPIISPAWARRLGQFGSDQAWISARLGPGRARFTRADGVLSYRNEARQYGRHLPSDVRLVSFHGQIDPWHNDAQKLPWVRENYR